MILLLTYLIQLLCPVLSPPRSCAELLYDHIYPGEERHRTCYSRRECWHRIRWAQFTDYLNSWYDSGLSVRNISVNQDCFLQWFQACYGQDRLGTPSSSPLHSRTLQCMKCMKPGDVVVACPSQEKSSRCGSAYKAEDCETGAPQCVNCLGDHDPT